MELELERLIKQQTKGDIGVTEDRIAWQVIRAVSTTMGHLSKDAIRKKGKRMMQQHSDDARAIAAGEQLKRRRKHKQTLLPPLLTVHHGLESTVKPEDGSVDTPQTQSPPASALPPPEQAVTPHDHSPASDRNPAEINTPVDAPDQPKEGKMTMGSEYAV